MMSILVRVALRPNPIISLGAIDSSCALLLCDIAIYDMPIVYCSEPFEALTGYTAAEILGKNCRFLQSPDGLVRPGVKRIYSDDSKIFKLKNMISAKEEAQTTLVNYKKNGQQFTNILTTIPIQWDGEQIRYIVGFQVDMGTCFV